LRTGAQTIERNGLGVPRYTGPEEPAPDDLAKGLAMAKAWRAGVNAGVAIPYGAHMDLVGVSGTLPDALPFIQYQDEQIARAVLAHFLNLGTQTGSWALGTTFADFFTLSLQTLAQQVADVATQHIIEDIVDVNWGPDEAAPRLVFQEIGSRREASADAIKVLVDSGVIRTDRDLEEFVRDVFGLPGKGLPSPTAAPPALPAPDSAPTAPPAQDGGAP
jgi:phage gp29-like protein